jgi:hypothetical protein
MAGRFIGIKSWKLSEAEAFIQVFRRVSLNPLVENITKLAPLDFLIEEGFDWQLRKFSRNIKWMSQVGIALACHRAKACRESEFSPCHEACCLLDLIPMPQLRE